MKTTRTLMLLSILSAMCYRTMFAQSPSFSRSDVDTGLHLSGAVVVGDFNGDGKPDLLLGVFPPSGIYLLPGNSNGTFGAPSQVFSGLSNGLAAADVNGDGKLDVLFTGTDPEVWVLLAHGDGTFEMSPIRSAGVASPRPPLVMDFNRDGRPDLAFADQGGGISILLGNGNGTFGSARNFPITAGEKANALVAADFNGDGILDLAASNLGNPDQFVGNSISVLLGNGDGTFGSSADFTVGTDPFPLITEDFNGDGKADLGVANYQSSSVSVLLGRGDGTFLPKLDFTVGPFPVGLASADFNGDGKLDFAVGGALLELSILLGNGDGTFAPKQDFPTASSFENLAVGDFNSDGKPDVAVVYFAANSTVSIFLNTTATDTAPPVITLSANLSTLRPPTGRTVPIVFSGTIIDRGSGVDASSVTFRVIDEYGIVQPSGGVQLSADGSFAFRVLLSASRRGLDLDGRSYTITVEAKDHAGNLGSAQVVVTVPHDQRRKPVAHVSKLLKKI